MTRAHAQFLLAAGRLSHGEAVLDTTRLRTWRIGRLLTSHGLEQDRGREGDRLDIAPGWAVRALIGRTPGRQAIVGFVPGGIALPPLRSLIWNCLDLRDW